MHHSKPVLVLDCDGVLYDLNGYVLRELVNPVLGTTYSDDDITDWKWSGLSPEARDIFYQSLDTPDVWHLGNAYPGAAADVQALAHHYSIVIVTAMRTRYKSLRALWLRNNNIPWDQLVTTPEKLKTARAFGAVAVVEDYAVTANIMSRASIPSYLVNRPWNRYAAVDAGVHRGSWADAVAELLERAK